MTRLLKFPIRRQRGAVLPWVAVCLVMLIGFTALAVDVGQLVTVHGDLQAAADAAALAAADGLTIGPDEARARALAYAAKNFANGQSVALEDVDIQLGLWNPTNRSFTPTADSGLIKPDAVRVTPRLTEERGNAVSALLAGIFGVQSSNVSTSATAWYRSRDIMLVLDYSGSMNDDSELAHLQQMGRAAVEGNLRLIWTQLGQPRYGNMQFDPVFISSTNTNTVKQTLGLTNVPYPYPAGTWDEYLWYVQNNANVNNAGYRRYYGGLTLVNYWLELRASANETPDLWMTSEQPITAVKDAVTVFLDFVRQVDTDDHIGLAAYTYTDGTAILESGLTNAFSLIEDISRHRQAAHYHDFTNIGAGIEKARIELEDNGRVGTFKMIVLMTDGIANRPNNISDGRRYALEQARLAGDAGLPIVTISLGAAADKPLLQQIADETGGVHFNVPGGGSVNEYTEDLMDIFRQIAAHRPLKLVD